ncbi:cytochrome c [Chlorella sorokiniana]|uniref:Cytochrome c n=1 Tax=Chlorella sorokiniana TaxID=3076 RepID=A0A2P6TJ14_CHLSO|nr:cytochrome c [Chlorella sorokiniana]|eukprot:PRW39227.1 cytochrome c [Chlorella sorokiniana]
MAKTPAKSKKSVAAKQPAADAAPQTKEEKLQQSMEEMVSFTREMAVLLLLFTGLRALWHVGIPTLFGAQPFVPLSWELAAVQSLNFLLYWAGGGLGSKRKERLWMLYIYNLVAMFVVGKCVLDAYIYHFQPTLWRHFSPNRPWGVPALLRARLPEQVLSGLEGRTVAALAQSLERGAEIICLFSAFKGVRAGKTLMQARRALKRQEAKKAADKKEE